MLKPRAALLCSTRAPGAADLVCRAQAQRTFEFVGCVTTDASCRDAAELESTGLPVWRHDIREFYRSAGRPLRDLDVRADYDTATLRLLRRYDPDLLVLCGYLHVATDVLLSAFPDRILNIHDSDLEQLGADGLPRYRGLHATRDAIFAGEAETRSSVHIVTAEIDVGPVLVRSGAYPTHPMLCDAIPAGATDVLKAYAYAQREWMMLDWTELLERGMARLTCLTHLERDEKRGAVSAIALAPWEVSAAAPAPAQCRAAGGQR